MLMYDMFFASYFIFPYYSSLLDYILKFCNFYNLSIDYIKLLIETHFCLYFKELEKTLDVFNITISRQQAEVEVIPDYLLIGRQ